MKDPDDEYETYEFDVEKGEVNFHSEVNESERRNKMAAPEDMWQCQTVTCGYIYNPDKGDRKGKIPKGTRFEDLPDDWKCPICGASKKMFRPLAGPGSVAAQE